MIIKKMGAEGIPVSTDNVRSLELLLLKSFVFPLHISPTGVPPSLRLLYYMCG